MQILTLGSRGRGANGTFIVEAGPANAISGEIKWERWGESEISIFYEPFPLLPLGSLWPSAPRRLPSSLIPFSKNVIRKSPFGLSAAMLSSCAGWAAHSYITARLSLSLPPFLPRSLPLSSVSLSASSATPSTPSHQSDEGHASRLFRAACNSSAQVQVGRVAPCSSSSAPHTVIKFSFSQRKDISSLTDSSTTCLKLF